MISQTAEYALRAVVYLAEHSEAGQTTEEIANATLISGPYLSKVLQQLVRASIVQSRRGLGGGFTLERNIAELTVLDVVNAVDPIQRIKKCPLDLPAHCDQLCSLHSRLDQAAAAVENAFSQTTIAQLLAEREGDNVYIFPFSKPQAKQAKRRK